MSEPDVKAVSLYNLFHEKAYVVPAFQRGYAWDEDNVNDLLIDLEGFWNDEKHLDTSYILGQMIIAPSDANMIKAGYKFSLIDGQQRATTLSLLFAAIQERVVDFQRSFPTEPWNNELLYLQDLLTFSTSFGRPKIPRLCSPYGGSDEMIIALVKGATPPNAATKSVERIIAAYQQILDFLNNRFKDAERDDLRHFFHVLMGRVYVVQLVVPTATDALVVFERINNRGLPLDAADLLKNLLFQNADESKFDSISLTWQTTLEELHKVKQKRLASMVYLLRAIALRGGQNVAQNSVYEHWSKILNSNPPAMTSAALANQIKTEGKNLVSVASGAGPQGSSSELSAGSSFLRILQHVPILLQAWHLGPQLYDEVAKLLEERVVLFALARERTAAFENYVPVIMRELSLLDTGSTRQDVLGAFAAAETSGSRSDLLERARLGVMALSYAKPAERNRQRYVLARVARAAQRAGGIPIVTWAEFLRRPTAQVGYQLDHIYPQSVQAGIERKHSIGNLVLLEAPLNAGLGAALPSSSQKTTAYANSGLFVNQVLAGANTNGRPQNQVPVIQGIRSLLTSSLVGQEYGKPDPESCLSIWDDQTAQALANTYWELFLEDLTYSKLP